jgi:hypothetical protein
MSRLKRRRLTTQLPAMAAQKSSDLVVAMYLSLIAQLTAAIQ